MPRLLTKAKLAAVAWVVFCVSSAVAQADQSKPISYSVFAPQQSDQSVKALSHLLGGDSKDTSVKMVNTLQAGIDSPDDILVIVLDKADFDTLGEFNADRLKQRKVIGIGFGAAQIFAEMRLENLVGQLRDGVIGVPKLRVQTNATLDKTEWNSARLFCLIRRHWIRRTPITTSCLVSMSVISIRKFGPASKSSRSSNKTPTMLR